MSEDRIEVGLFENVMIRKLKASGDLNRWESEFIKSIQGLEYISPSQEDKLHEMYDKGFI